MWVLEQEEVSAAATGEEDSGVLAVVMVFVAYAG
jgi:hypothetical protein